MRMEQGARIIVESWLHAQPEDVLHFITDETKLEEARAFSEAACRAGAIPKLTVLPADSVQAGDSIEQMREIMSYATAIVGATNYSFITTNAVDYALRHGARFLSLPLSTNNGQSLLEQEFLKMRPSAAARMGRPIARCLKGSDSVHITTALGTDITFGIQGRKHGMFNGVAARAGVCASAIQDGTRLLDNVGPTGLLPQVLSALGALFTAAGVGTVIANGVGAIVPDGNKLAAVAVYCIAMALFTIIMGNGFAAFSVITVGIGIPFVIAQGANPVVVGALGLTAGYCGTLVTPMAANFNIMPAALLETKSKYAIIWSQMPVAITMLIIHIILMYVLAF